MKKNKFLGSVFALLLSATAFAQRVDTAATRAYIQQYKDIAIEEMQRAGIPASITLAQGIHESGLGKSYLAQNTNNHFGIKCHENWTGKTFKYSDDAPDECFRVYDNAEESYKDHSDFLKNRTRYAALFQLDKTDYKGWAYGLKKAGYATNPRYPEILIKTVEDFQLDLLDKGQNPAYLSEPIVVGKADDNEIMVMDNTDQDAPSGISDDKSENKVSAENETFEPVSTGEQKIVKINKRKAVLISNGETPEMIGDILHIPTDELLTYNDIKDASQIKNGDVVFIQLKKKRNREGKYVVKEQDNMWSISQMKGIQLASLLRRNRMEPGEEAAVNETLNLKGTARVKPQLRIIAEPKVEIENTPVASVQNNSEPVKSNEQYTEAASPAESKVMDKAPASEMMQDSDKSDVIADVESTPAETVANAPAAPASVQPETKTVYPSVIDYSKLPKSSSGFHTVIKGDTMYNICKRYNVSIAQIMEWNNLPDQSVKLGQVLKIQP